MSKELKLRTQEEWLQARQNVVTATEVSSIVGLNKYRSANKMWQEKQNKEFQGNSYTFIGHMLEPAVVQSTNHVLQKDFSLYEDMGTKSFFVDTGARIGATPDATDGHSLLECKTSGPHNVLKWAFSPNPQYICQLYTQMLCTGLSEGYLACLSTNLTQYSPELKLPLTVHKVLDDPVIYDIIREEVARFWDALDRDIMFRVNRTRSKQLEWRLRFNAQKVF